MSIDCLREHNYDVIGLRTAGVRNLCCSGFLATNGMSYRTRSPFSLQHESVVIPGVNSWKTMKNYALFCFLLFCFVVVVLVVVSSPWFYKNESR